MRASKEYTKHDYILDCKEEGGEPFGFKSVQEASQYILKLFPNLTEQEATESVLNDTNCDWVVFEDDSVLFRYYGKNYDDTVIDEIREKGHRE